MSISLPSGFPLFSLYVAQDYPWCQLTFLQHVFPLPLKIIADRGFPFNELLFDKLRKSSVLVLPRTLYQNAIIAHGGERGLVSSFRKSFKD